MNKTIQKKDQSEKRKKLAEELREAFKTISPFIEKHTAIVCPDCTSLCCKDKHARYDDNDIIFMKALGEYVAQDHTGRKKLDSCRYIAETGCTLDRWKRPYRCTFFFCTPLLKSLEDDNPKLYRAFVEYFQYLVSVRSDLLDL